MKKRFIAMLLGTLITTTTLAGCGATGSREANTGDSAQAEAADAAASGSSEEDAGKGAGGTPWIDADIKENVTADMQVDPKDDLYLYANKDWILENEIPDGYSSWSNYSKRALDVKKQCMELLKDESIEGHDADLVRTYNKLILDWDTRNKLGVSELQDAYNKITEAKSIDDISKLLTDKDTVYDYFNFFDYDIDTGLNNPDKNIMIIASPALILDDSAEYPDRSELGDMNYGYSKDLFVHIAQKFGMTKDEADKCFENALSLETKLAPSIFTTEDQLSSDYFEKINNEMSFDEAVSNSKAFPLKDILTSMGVVYDGEYLVLEPDYLKKLDEVYTQDNLELIKSLMTVNYVLDSALIIDRDSYDKRNELRNKYFGTTGAVSDDEMAYGVVSEELPDSMQIVYVEKYGTEEDRQKMKELCQDVIDTYKELLSENDWASEETKKYAVEKLNSITIHAAYPDKFNDTTGIDIAGCSLIEANERIADNLIKEKVGRLGKNEDKEKWADGFPLLSCNAFYSPTDNSINMIIGMMGEPFYSSDMCVEDLYASIGAFWVGHEISHAFDANGSQFDKEGKLNAWMPDADQEQFQKRIEKMDKYLDTIVAFGDNHFIGSNIDTEMTADMTGLQCALRMASKVEGFDYEKFFIKYAQLNANIATYASELDQVSQDEHPLDYSRANVPVQQFDEFYKAFDVKEGDNMYLAPEDRLIVW